MTAPVVLWARQYPAITWQEYQQDGPRRQAVLRCIALCELMSIDTGPVEERALWPLVYRDLTAMRIASGRVPLTVEACMTALVATLPPAPDSPRPER